MTLGCASSLLAASTKKRGAQATKKEGGNNVEGWGSQRRRAPPTTLLHPTNKFVLEIAERRLRTPRRRDTRIADLIRPRLQRGALRPALLAAIEVRRRLGAQRAELLAHVARCVAPADCLVTTALANIAVHGRARARRSGARGEDNEERGSHFLSIAALVSVSTSESAAKRSSLACSVSPRALCAAARASSRFSVKTSSARPSASPLSTS